MHRSIAVIVWLAFIVAGCAGSGTDRRLFNDVRALVADRTGGLRVQWNTDSAADRAAADAVSAVLNDDLTSDAAVQIALLNNRDLQAVFEQMGVAQADLIAAGLLKNPVFDADIRFSTAGGGTGVEMTVLQDFLDVLWIPLKRRVAAAALESAKLRAAEAAVSLAGEVREGYIQLQASQQLLALRRQVVAANSVARELAVRLHNAGNITELDLASEQAAFEQSKLDASDAEQRVVEHRERLNALMGVSSPAAQRWSVAQGLPEVVDDELKYDQIERGALERSLTLAQARQDLIRQGERLGLTTSAAATLADASIGAGAERDVGGGWGVGPAMSIPIPLFNMGQTARRIRAGATSRRGAAVCLACRSDWRRSAGRFRAVAVGPRSRSSSRSDPAATPADR